MPSSGENPIVVSQEQPSRTAVTEQPPPGGRRRGKDPRADGPEAPEPAPRSIRPTVRESRTCGSPSRPASARVGRRRRPPRAWWRGRRCRRRRPAAHRAGTARRGRCPRGRMRCGAARVARGLAMPARTSASTTTGSGTDRRRGRRGARPRRPRPGRRPRAPRPAGSCLRGDEVELEARRAGVDDEDRAHRDAIGAGHAGRASVPSARCLTPCTSPLR